MDSEIAYTLGERRRGREIGKSPGHLFEYQACIDCGERRWVQCIHGEPGAIRCPSCSQIRSAVLHPRKREPHSLETKRKISQKRRENQMWGNRSGAWKGGRKYHKSGYVQVYVDVDDFFFPMAKRSKLAIGGYVMEHRLIMAKHLKRCLLPWEIVHHKNGIRSDNRLENLELFKCQAEHMPSIHAKQSLDRLNKRIEELEIRMTQLEAENCLLRMQLETVNG
ncbi:MAG: HNH endonuclease [Dehalococcoidales bacterium]|nr:HNH endonuclease [Dehalococcoidales bacterium]